MNRISIVPLGCAKNENDAENLASLLKKQGFAIEPDPNKADALVVHTCSFIDAAKKESIRTILDATRNKRSGKKLIVTGCLVQHYGQELMKEFPEVDAFLGTGQLAQIPDLLTRPRERFLDKSNPGGLLDPDAPRQRFVQGPTAYLRLSEGCSHPCTFCVIPRLRGRLKSRPQEKIYREARILIEEGVEELILISQDTGDWGRDLYGPAGRPGRPADLPRLLRELRKLKGLRWIRLMYMHPASFDPELFQILSESPDLFPYLDIPLQHIDHQILAAMKRRHSESDARNLLDEIHKKLPHLSLRTTFITGFPGESAAQFKRLLNFVKEGHFDYAGSFTYSREEGTPASRMKPQISERIKEERQKILADAQYEVARKKAEGRLGKIETVIVDEKEGRWLLGRTAQEAPEIDAVVRLHPKGLPNGKKFVPIRLTSFDAYEYTAKVVGEGRGEGHRF
ncbi:MAG: 30S ribosomal protein S12 methylthiotransferase RimO [Elusimicrobia bacterium]|nr:30S ribosomal protein S12 methylthiotransferase RimO [Candidatus Obscuribacterium magneticum]